MENIAEKLNLVIDYIESHLTGDIDQEQIAKIACCSYYDVGRMFSLIADISLSDYIRKRKLTLAGKELKYDNGKVMDVAIKYGYDSPVSFARAFQGFHGFNPGLANKENAVLKVFPRLVYQICVSEVLEVVKSDTITMNGKEYKASCFGEQDLSYWSEVFTKRVFWRVENAYEDVKDKIMLNQVLPYNNYPPMNIEIGQVFAVDYYKSCGAVERKYYIADGTVWEDMPCTREFLLDYLQPIRTDTISIGEREFKASYFGEQDMSEWSDYATKREFWRLEGTKGMLENGELCNELLPYNNYPLIKIEEGQIFVVDYHTVIGEINRKFYVADGTVWRDMFCTRQFIIKK